MTLNTRTCVTGRFREDSGSAVNTAAYFWQVGGKKKKRESHLSVTVMSEYSGKMEKSGIPSESETDDQMKC